MKSYKRKYQKQNRTTNITVMNFSWKANNLSKVLGDAKYSIAHQVYRFYQNNLQSPRTNTLPEHIAETKISAVCKNKDLHWYWKKMKDFKWSLNFQRKMKRILLNHWKVTTNIKSGSLYWLLQICCF